MINSTPKISVILPFFNAEKTLNRAIKSIANQSFQNFKCILINNNSIDNGVAVAKKWETDDKRFKLINEKKQGVVFASNKGTQLAKGEYITRMDADDEMHPDKLKLQSAFLDLNPDFSAVASLVEYISHNRKNTKGFKRYVNWNNSVQTYHELVKNQFIEMPLVNPTCMWRKSASDNYGLYKNGNFPEDYEMWLRWLEAGAKIYKLPQKLLKWYDSDTRLTRTHSKYSNEAFYKIKTAYLVKWLKKNNPFHPSVVVWGASKISRRRTALLKNYEIEIKAYIDIKKSRQIDLPVIYYKNIESPGKYFILVFIKKEDARQQITEFLSKKGFIEGKDFLHVS